jgi:AcrR family transcriptional regulator
MPTQTFINLPEEKKTRILDAIINELSIHTYEHINIQNIIKEAKIPRGSFYQYFKDKDDVFAYFYDHLKKIKLDFWGPLFTKPLEISFLDRMKMIYVKGYEFDQKYPRLVKVAKKISESPAFKEDKTYQEGMKQSIQIYKHFIEIDQKKDLIRKDLDSEFLAKMIIEFMQKVTLEELLKDTADLNVVKDKANTLIEIIGKGIQKHV